LGLLLNASADFQVTRNDAADVARLMQVEHH
jgi:hypothetical protein